MLRALHKINKAKRLEGEAVMSAPPFFQSAGRGDLKFWGEDDGPTVVVWESLSESEQEQWLEKVGKSKDCVVWCRSRGKDEEQRPFEVDGKEIFSNRSKQAKPNVEANPSGPWPASAASHGDNAAKLDSHFCTFRAFSAL